MLSAQTLMVAIKAVHREGNALAEAMEDEDNPDLDIIQQDLLAVSKAESELKTAYEAIQTQSDNLPLYKRVIDAA